MTIQTLDGAASPAAPDAGTDATGAIVEIHAGVERALAGYDQAEGSHYQQYRAMLAISDAMAAHTATEQELLYPALRERTGRHDGAIQRLLEQQHLLDVLLRELGGMMPSDRRFGAKVELLVDLFRQHVREQELTLLPELRRRLDAGERRRLGRELLARTGTLVQGPRATA